MLSEVRVSEESQADYGGWHPAYIVETLLCICWEPEYRKEEALGAHLHCICELDRSRNKER